MKVKNKLTSITIVIGYSLSEIKQAYKLYYGENKIPTKNDLAIWLGALADADILDTLSNNN